MKFKTVMVCSVFGMLAACSSGPSDADIKQVLEKELEATQAPMKSLGMDLGIKLLSAKQVGCTKDKEGSAYVCDIQLSIQSKNLMTGALETKDGTEKMRFVKTEKGWVASK